MAKSKRKTSAAQRDKTNILIAKILKEKGVISKQANLHSGRFISKDVLKKVKQYQDIARLDYVPVKVSKETAKAARERGYMVVQGNKVIGPKSTQFRNRLKRDELTGIKPVKGGYMEEVTLPHTIFDMRSLIEQLQEGIDTLKLPGEQFAFKYRGNESYRAFMNSQQLLEYLMHYKGIEASLESNKTEDLQEEFDSITLFRLHPNDISRSLPGMKERQKRSREKRQLRIQSGELVVKRKTRAERFAKMPPKQVERILRQDREKQARKMEKLRNDPLALQKFREKEKERLKKYRERTKL